jgi:hypothetical protein
MATKAAIRGALATVEINCDPMVSRQFFQSWVQSQYIGSGQEYNIQSSLKVGLGENMCASSLPVGNIRSLFASGGDGSVGGRSKKGCGSACSGIFMEVRGEEVTSGNELDAMREGLLG